MTNRDKPDPAGKPPIGHASDADPKTTPVSQEPGTRGPDGPLDDQPQREDEYLSSLLNEFNPQRKDEDTPATGPERKQDPKTGEQGGDVGKKKEPS